MDNATDTLKYTCIETPSFCKEIGLKPSDVDAIAVSGNNDLAVAETARQDYVMSQFNGINTNDLISACSYLGDGYDAHNDRQKAIEFIVWYGAWNISEDDDI